MSSSNSEQLVSEYFLPEVGWQSMLSEARERDIWVWGGRQIGKSRTFIKMQSVDVLAGGRNVYSCPDPDTADNNWLDICNAFRAIDDSVRVNKVERGVIELMSPVSGRIGQYKRYIAKQQRAQAGSQRVRGARVNSILHDEIQLAANGAKYYAASSALTMISRGREYVCMTSPADPVQMLGCAWIIEKFERAGLIEGAGTERAKYIHSPKGFVDTLFVRQPTTPEILAPVMQAQAILNDDPGADKPLAHWVRIAEDTLTNILEKIGEAEFNCEYLCSMEVDTSGLIVDEWHPDRATTDAEYNPNLPVLWCADAGDSSAASVVLMFQVEQKLAADGTMMSTFNFFDELHTFDARQGNDLMIADCMQFAVDPAYQTILTHSDEFPRSLPYALPAMSYPDIHAKDIIKGLDDIGLEHHEGGYPVWTQIRTLNYMVRSGRMRVHPRCTLLMSNFGAWARTAKGEPGQTNNDSAQACAYGILGYLVTSGEGIEAVEQARALLDKHKGEKREMVELLYI